MSQPRRKSDLVRRLMEEAERPCTGRGGDSYRLRRCQPLMREAAALLANWGWPAAKRARTECQPADGYVLPLWRSIRDPGS
jgi:hypothetical protein